MFFHLILRNYFEFTILISIFSFNLFKVCNNEIPFIFIPTTYKYSSLIYLFSQEISTLSFKISVIGLNAMFILNR